MSVTVLFDADINLPIDYEVVRKYCHKCTQRKATLSESGFQSWFADHFDWPSSEIKKMFEQSKEWTLVQIYGE